MNSPALLAANHMSINRVNQEKIANNIANANTRGYQADKPLIVEDERNKNFADTLSFTRVMEKQRDISMGEIVNTQSKFDVALTTPDTYFAVQDNNGKTFFTRNGQLSLNEQRQLIQAASRFPITDENQGPISLPEGSTNIEISADGVLSADGISIAKIGAFKFANSQNMMKIGNTLMQASDAPTIAEDAKMQQESLESSNVNPVIALTQMIELQRQDGQDAYLIKMYKEHSSQQIDDLLIPLKV